MKTDVSMIENITPQFLSMIKMLDSSCRKLNYLMVMPKQISNMNLQYNFPIGFGIVSSALKASGRNVFTLNLTYKETPLDLLKKTIVDNNIDVVLTGGLSGQYALLREITDTAKSVNPSIITIVGGGIITAEPEVAMKALENVDYGVIGEGEITNNALAYALETDGDISEIEGVISKKNGQFILTPPPQEILDLDCLPFPDYDGFDYAECFERNLSGSLFIKDFGGAFLLSRSCPYNCTFCFHSSGKRYRRRSLDSFFKEFDWVKSKFDFNFVSLYDELFGGDFAYISEFCKRIKPYNLTYTVTVRLDIMSDEILDLLKDSGCILISFGVEHISDKILKSMQKKSSSELIEPTLNKVLQKGMRPIANIIFGDLAETPETVDECLEWWRKHRQFDIRILHIMVFPGSYVYKVACEKGIIKDPVQYLRDGCPLINITTMSDEEWAKQKDKISLYVTLDLKDEPHPDVEQIQKTLDILGTRMPNKIAVWPVTHENIQFFAKMSKTFCENAYFINQDTDRQLLRSGDKTQIYAPDIIRIKDVQIVICPKIYLVDEIREICKKDYPCVQKVISVRDIENLNNTDLTPPNCC